MNKHAYLIMAHNQFYILEKLILLLDDERNDIYIHIDKKVEDFNFDHFKKLVEKSNVFFTERTSVNWGGYSQINCELFLLKAATKNNYAYYHLLSGIDLPLKSNDEIHEFFDLNNGKEFIHFSESIDQSVWDRFCLYHFLAEKAPKSVMIYKLEQLSLRLQKLLHVNRYRNKNLNIQFGANWFSITHDLATYILSKEEQIKKLYKNSSCCDEIFLQTIVLNSEFKNKMFIKDPKGDYFSCLRLIDWKRGNPYVYRKEDYSLLINSEYLFARKFDINVDSEIIDMIYDHVTELNSK